MKIEINYDVSSEHYVWALWDGPDGIDFYEGIELDVGQCFEQIIKYRVLNSLNYSDSSETRATC